LNFAGADAFLGIMAADERFADLCEHLARTTRLSHPEAERVVAEVLAYFAEPLDVYVARRHAELRKDELKNPDIYARIREELGERRFAAPVLTERQIRRMVYG
jgi:hypothetical protein